MDWGSPEAAGKIAWVMAPDVLGSVTKGGAGEGGLPAPGKVGSTIKAWDGIWGVGPRQCNINTIIINL